MLQKLVAYVVQVALEEPCSSALVSWYHPRPESDDTEPGCNETNILLNGNRPMGHHSTDRLPPQ